MHINSKACSNVIHLGGCNQNRIFENKQHHNGWIMHHKNSIWAIAMRATIQFIDFDGCDCDQMGIKKIVTQTCFRNRIAFGMGLFPPRKIRTLILPMLASGQISST